MILPGELPAYIGPESFRTFEAISTPICVPSLAAELVALRLSW